MRSRIRRKQRYPTGPASPPPARSSAPLVPRLGQGLTGQLGPPAPQQRAQPQARGLWSLVIAVVAAAAALVGSWVLPAMTTPVGEDAGLPWIVFAPVSGFIGGLMAGYIIGWRHLGGLGAAAALGSFAAAELLVWVAYSAAPHDMNLLPFHFAIPGVPFAVGCLMGDVWSRPGGAEAADNVFSYLSGFFPRW
jgi:hypothetical protein